MYHHTLNSVMWCWGSSQDFVQDTQALYQQSYPVSLHDRVLQAADAPNLAVLFSSRTLDASCLSAWWEKEGAFQELRVQQVEVFSCRSDDLNSMP